MSIVRLQKVTFYGHHSEKERVLEDLQTMGCLHLENLVVGDDFRLPSGSGVSPEIRDAFRFLKDCPRKQEPATDDSGFDPSKVKDRLIEIQERLTVLEDERDFLANRIEDVEPWGEFQFLPLAESGGVRFWFYVVPRHRLKDVKELGLDYETLREDDRNGYIIVISQEEPEGMPVDRVFTGNRPLSELRANLDTVESEIADLQEERSGLTRWLPFFKRSIHRLEDASARTKAAAQTLDTTPLFALQAWAPHEHVEKLESYALENRLVLQHEDPAREESPPTLLRNDPRLAVGENLVSFYTTPGYRLWDPSLVVLFSFSLFFAMIISDAGYGLVLAVILFLTNKKLAATPSGLRFRTLLRMLTVSTIVWGVLVGSYFGLTPPEGGLLGKIQILDVYDMGTMMKLSIFIGAAHVILANAMDAKRQLPGTSALAPVGWIVVILGAITLWFASDQESATLQTSGAIALISGFLLVFLFAGAGKPIVGRLATGVLSLTRVTNAFGDVLSYLRLFALGLASASLAVAFNDLARDAHQGIPYVGIVLAVLIIVLGHTLNFVLALVSGFVHGLRLNLIEFFNWSLAEEGTPFRPFAKKEISTQLNH